MDILAVIEQALSEHGISARHASLKATGKPDLIREMRRGRSPSVDRLDALCRALDLEFYVGPRRVAHSDATERPHWADEFQAEIRALRSDVRTGFAAILQRADRHNI